MRANGDDTLARTPLVDSYEAVAYEAKPNPVSHPDHLAAIATMFGLEAPEIDHARILELGCSDGSNLLPVAATLPNSRCVGCDLAPTPIRVAREATAALGLGNVEWFASDLRELSTSLGAFDYIIAHGVYSWVPAPCAMRCSISLPVRSLRTASCCQLQRLSRRAHETRSIGDPAAPYGDAPTLRDKLTGARELAALLANAGTTHDAADTAIQTELRGLPR
jgi:trans-aconitate methyltransferase